MFQAAFEETPEPGTESIAKGLYYLCVAIEEIKQDLAEIKKYGDGNKRI
ncbi:MAG: hypothetical protein JWM68_5584 [Verrucomicrobiales bacterium]|nr:hypothetical protein [Verrucomicrobiales bacterium]